MNQTSLTTKSLQFDHLIWKSSSHSLWLLDVMQSVQFGESFGPVYTGIILNNSTNFLTQIWLSLIKDTFV